MKHPITLSESELILILASLLILSNELNHSPIKGARRYSKKVSKVKGRVIKSLNK